MTTELLNPQAAAEDERGRPDAAPDGVPITRLAPPQGWRLVNLGELWRFRELMYFLVWRDVKVRYKQTVLGASWAILQPFLMMIVFTIFFGRMAGVPSGDLPYPLFAFAGLLPWTFFATAITAAGNSVVGSERLVTKIYFPRLAVPFSAVGAAVVDFACASVVLVAMMAYYGVGTGPTVVLAPLIVGLIMVAALGLGTLLAALNVSYRDIRYVIPFLVQIGMFATPSIYMEPKPGNSLLAQALCYGNPLTILIADFRSAITGQPVAPGPLLASGSLCVLLLVVGCLYFRKVEDGFADVI